MGGAGAWVPYVALHLEQQHLSPQALGVAMTLAALARVIAGPIWGWAADYTRREDHVLRLASLLAVGTGLIVVLGSGTWLLVAGLVLYSIARAPMGPVIDAATVRAVEQRGQDSSAYARIRLWGSVAFLACGAAGGLLADHLDASAPLAVGIGATAALALASGFVGRGQPPATGLGSAWRRLITHRGLVVFWLAATLHGAALSAYDMLYAMHLTHLGLPASWTGPGLAAGIGAEVLLFAMAGRALSIGPWRLVAVGMLAGALRFALMTQIDDPYGQTVLQLLHGLAYGGFWVGAVEGLRREVPDAARTSAQALLVGATYGLGPMICGLLVTGLLEVHGTEGVFLAGAVMSGAAAVLVLAGSRPVASD